MSEKTGAPPPYPSHPQYTNAATVGYNQPQYGYNTQYGAQYGVQSGTNVPPPPPPGVAVTTAPGVVVVTSQPAKILTRHPTSIVCQHCRQTVVTRPRSEIGTITWLACGAMILFGLWLGCCLIPFCLPDLQDTYHECPNCNKVIDIHKPL